MSELLQAAQDLFSYTQDLRRDFHRHPELGFQEYRTAGRVAQELSQLGLDVTQGVGETGVVGILEGAKSGPVILVRFDMDALPIQEETGAEYTSQNPGVMHACGHDGHTAIGLGVARLLNSRRATLPGTVKFVFQPAEEIVAGARKMIADGVLDNPSPDLALGLHLWNSKPLGWIGAVPGAVMSAADGFRIVVDGRGGHGAYPHLATDPVIVANQLIAAMQTIISRNVPATEEAVISVTQIHGGDTHNVIPSRVWFEGTLRSFDPEVRTVLQNRIEALCQGFAAGFGCVVEIVYFASTPAVRNDPQVTEMVAALVSELYPSFELDRQERTMGSEDMALFLEQIPGCFLFVGSSNAAEGLDAAHHHPKFDFDEKTLPVGVGLMAAAVERLLQDGGRPA